MFVKNIYIHSNFCGRPWYNTATIIKKYLINLFIVYLNYIITKFYLGFKVELQYIFINLLLLLLLTLRIVSYNYNL